ncbi:MAG: class I adenylate-forming enzyme family protein [Deferribacterales bacterium]
MVLQNNKVVYITTHQRGKDTMLNMGYFLINSANTYPDKTALVCEDKRISYSQLNIRAAKLANSLIELGVKKGDKVAYLFPNCIELVETYFAIQKIGAVAVPLNHRLVFSEIRYLLESADCSIFFYSEKYRDIAIECGGTSIDVLKQCICTTDNPSEVELGYEQFLANGAEVEPDIEVSNDDLCRIQFTGGTTGIPKGVMHTHEQDALTMLSLLTQTKIGTVPDEVVMAQSPMNHHGGYTWVMCAIAAGCTYVMQDKFDSKKILEAIEREKVTYLLLLPPSSYLRLTQSDHMKEYDVSSIKVIQTSAGGTSKEIANAVFQNFPNAEMHYGWAQTESGVGTKLILTRDMDIDSELFNSIGSPAGLIELKIIDDRGVEVPEGAVGECVVKGPTIMSGYYGQPELTEKTFCGKWLHTGDMLYKKNGYYYMVGRKTDMVKTGGENVYSKDVESVLLSNPCIAECAVVGIRDDKWGEAIAAVIRPCEGKTITCEDLLKYCKCNMASYKKPKYICITTDPIADSAGKINKSRISEKYVFNCITED